MRSVSDGWRMSSENKLVGREDVRDNQGRLPNSKIRNKQQRGFESKILEQKFE